MLSLIPALMKSLEGSPDEFLNDKKVWRVLYIFAKIRKTKIIMTCQVSNNWRIIDE